MSDFDDDDADDDLLLKIQWPAQASGTATTAPATNPANEHEAQLFRAKGEIAVLRAQLQSLQALSLNDASRLRHELQAAQAAAKSQIEALKLSVEKLEDEKKFLGNEIRALSAVKRRKVGESESKPEQRPPEKAEVAVARVQIQDDWSQLCHHVWHHTINGCPRTTLSMLAKIGPPADLAEPADAFLHVRQKTPFSESIWACLMTLRSMRLDHAISCLCTELLRATTELTYMHSRGNASAETAIPFLLSVVHSAITFKSSAVAKELVLSLVKSTCEILKHFLDAADAAMTELAQYLHNLALVVCFDVMETAVVLAARFGAAFASEIWQAPNLHMDLVQRVFPENTERFVSVVQMNLVYNVVEMLLASVFEGRFATGVVHKDELLVKSLFKVFLIDIPPRAKFAFYGLNRFNGNNGDIQFVCEAIPENPNLTALVVKPYPVQPCTLLDFEERLEQAGHTISLRVRAAQLLEELVVAGNMNLLALKENVKLIVRIIGFEQNHLMHQPRCAFVHQRLLIIAAFTRLLYYIIEDRNINTVIYPETLYEIFVVLMRMAFALDSLYEAAHALLVQIRSKGFTGPVFNGACELLARETAHFLMHDAKANKFSSLAELESGFANGLEFPYDLETVEVAREILGLCVNHDEADNLYYNMNGAATQ